MVSGVAKWARAESAPGAWLPSLDCFPERARYYFGAKALKFQENVPSSPGATEERRQMNRLYLAHRLASLVG